MSHDILVTDFSKTPIWVNKESYMCRRKFSKVYAKMEQNNLQLSDAYGGTEHYVDTTFTKRLDSTISSCLNRICLNQELSDVTFAFPEESKSVPAHKLILSMRSPVFKDMFYGTFPQLGEITTVDVLDTDVITFMHMLRFVYTDEVHLDGKNVTCLLQAAVKYQIKPLQISCETYLKEMLCEDNACTVYYYARSYSLYQLEKYCLSFIDKNAREVFAGQNFNLLSSGNLLKLLQRNSLKISEMDIFAAVLRWAEAKLLDSKSPVTPAGKREKLLPRILYSIALPSITLEDFTSKVIPSGVLSDTEQLMLFKSITMGEKSGIASIFRVQPRNFARPYTVLCRLMFPEYRRGRPLTDNECQNTCHYQNLYIKPDTQIRMLSAVLNIDVQNAQQDQGSSCQACFQKSSAWQTTSAKVIPHTCKDDSKIRKTMNNNQKIDLSATITVKGNCYKGLFNKNGECTIKIDEIFPPQEVRNIEFFIGDHTNLMNTLQENFAGMSPFDKGFITKAQNRPPKRKQQLNQNWKQITVLNENVIIELSMDNNNTCYFVTSLDIEVIG